jgi:hypothetical protein
VFEVQPESSSPAPEKIRRLTAASEHRPPGPTPEAAVPMKRGRLVACDAAPRCSAHTSAGRPCRKNAIKGMTVCYTHGGAAPQVREAARLRLAFLADPAVRRLAKIIKHGEDAQALAAIKVVLDRNELFASGVEPPQRGAFQPADTVQTQINMPEAKVAEMSDADLKAYDRLLTELKELLPKDEPKRLAA